MGTLLSSPGFKPYLLDLTGKSKRKASSYQLYQTFSFLYWRPPESPLRREVEELWEKRHEDHVREVLSPASLKEATKSSATHSEKLVFHMAVMRWKVNALTPNELDVLNTWIDGEQKSKNMPPWSQEANEYGDVHFAESSHIQRYTI